MDFAAVLDGLARNASFDESGMVRSNSTSTSADFLRVLQGLEKSGRPGGVDAMDAYRAEQGRTGQGLSAKQLDDDRPTLDTDPDEIAFELDLSSVRSLDQLSTLRRRFAMLNHPDRLPEPYRAAATIRMTIANAMIDRRASMLSR